MFKTVERVEGIHAVPLVPLRVATGLLMIHHGGWLPGLSAQIQTFKRQPSHIRTPAGSEGGFWPANFGTPGFEGFVDYVLKPYFGFLPGDLALWSAVHDYAEFW